MTRVTSRAIAADTLTPVALMRRLLATGDEAFLLESVEGGAHRARYSFLGVRPRARVGASDGAVFLDSGGRRQPLAEDFLPAVTSRTVRSDFARESAGTPFSFGAVGYLSYDAVRLFEQLPSRHPRASSMPDALFLLFDAVAAFDHARSVLILQTRDDAGAPARLDELAALLSADSPPEPSGFGPPPTFSEVTSREGFLRSVGRARESIAAGDIYQIQISRRWEADLPVDSFEVYRALRRINPSPYQFFLRTREADLVGASPEVMVRVRGGLAESRPIAGTYPRGASPAADAELTRRFLADPKERAEHVMLVDLARNDLGRVCETGSVSVPEFFTVEKYSHVQHLVSSVTGRVRAGTSALDVLAASFPAGTLTGAPKIRAMELIDELEPARRGIYGGAVGYLDVSGDLDSAIAIRTISVEGGRSRIQAAAGIVADSVPENEARETEIKSQALFRAVEEACIRP